MVENELEIYFFVIGQKVVISLPCLPKKQVDVRPNIYIFPTVRLSPDDPIPHGVHDFPRTGDSPLSRGNDP